MGFSPFPEIHSTQSATVGQVSCAALIRRPARSDLCAASTHIPRHWALRADIAHRGRLTDVVNLANESQYGTTDIGQRHQLTVDGETASHHPVMRDELLDPLKTAKARIDFVRQLHDREALLPREAQRRFLDSEGWIAWSGPAISELLKQFVAHNRMMTGGFAINGQLVTLTDISCPVLAFVGEVDDIGQPAAVRGIRRAAPNAEVYEYSLRTGHFGLVVGSKAAQETWPTVADWVLWISGNGEKPTDIFPMADQPGEHTDRGVALSSRLVHGLGRHPGWR